MEKPTFICLFNVQKTSVCDPGRESKVRLGFIFMVLQQMCQKLHTEVKRSIKAQ